MFSYPHVAKLKIIPLHTTMLTNELALINYECNFRLNKYRAEVCDQFVIVSSQTFTTLFIAAELATLHQSLLTPQVIFIDSSRYAEKFWRLFCEFIQAVQTDFKDELKVFLTDNTQLTCPESFSAEQKKLFVKASLKYICNLFEKYEFNYMRNLILQAMYFQQNWLSIKTFADLRDYFLKNKYYFTFVFNGSELIPSSEHGSFKLAPVPVLKRMRLTRIEEAEEEVKNEVKDESDVKHFRFGH